MPRRTSEVEAFVMMNPPISTLSPTSIRRRVEMFSAAAGVGGPVAQLPWTLKMMCALGKPMVAVSTGVGFPQTTELT